MIGKTITFDTVNRGRLTGIVLDKILTAEKVFRYNDDYNNSQIEGYLGCVSTTRYLVKIITEGDFNGNIDIIKPLKIISIQDK